MESAFTNELKSNIRFLGHVEGSWPGNGLCVSVCVIVSVYVCVLGEQRAKKRIVFVVKSQTTWNSIHLSYADINFYGFFLIPGETRKTSFCQSKIWKF